MAPQSVIQRSLLAYVRTQEDQADHAGVKFLNATGQSGRGMLDLFKRLGNEALFNTRYIDPYLQSHPLPPERVAALEVLVKASPYFDRKDSPELQLRHDLMRAKLSGFLDRPDTVARRYPLGDHSLPARYARAISTYRHGDLRDALPQIDGLIQTEPNNPYFHELKGQALLEGGRPADAIAPLRHAVTLAHGAPLIDIMLGQALIATNNTKNAEEAVPLLRAALSREPEAPDAYAQLAMAYGRKGDLANADLAAAQAAFNRGDVKTARQLASRAKTRLPVGSPAWVQADDIVNVKPNAKN
jgi:predicted Zn-dependent protease